jgi:hypothetical protein
MQYEQDVLHTSSSYLITHQKSLDLADLVGMKQFIHMTTCDYHIPVQH